MTFGMETVVRRKGARRMNSITEMHVEKNGADIEYVSPAIFVARLVNLHGW